MRTRSGKSSRDVSRPYPRTGRRRPRARSLLGRSAPYLFIAPTGIVIAIVFGYPMVSVVWDSLHVPALMGETSFGIDNYTSVLADPLFRSALLNNLRLFTVVPVMTALAVVFAAVLYEKIVGSRFYRFVVFLPYVIAVPVVGIVFSYVWQKNGLLNQGLNEAGLSGITHDWLGDGRTAIWAVWFVILWQQLGFGVVLFLARLGSLDVGLIEAAQLDRAGWWRRLWHVVLPHLAGTIEFFVTLSLINMLSWVFNYVYVMTGGGPVRSTYVLELVIFNSAFQDNQMNLAAAVSVVVLLVAAVILTVQAALRRRVERMEGP